MADVITTDLAELAPDTLVAQPGTTDVFGDFVPSGQALSIDDCYIRGKISLIRDTAGREVVSSVQVYVLGTSPGLSVEDYRYTLPSRFEPREDLRAISVKKVSDENGAHHEVVMFP